MLVRWTNPFASLFDVENFSEPFFSVKRFWSPLVDVKEEENQFIIDVETPGMDEKDIKISIENSAIHIEGEKVIGKSSRSFSKSFTLPDSIDMENTEALVENGILTVKIPKIKKEAPKKIEVKIATSKK